MAMTRDNPLVGFELLMAQSCGGFVHGLSPYEAGVFMLPVDGRRSSSAGRLRALSRVWDYGTVATGGMALSAEFLWRH